MVMMQRESHGILSMGAGLYWKESRRNPWTNKEVAVCNRLTEHTHKNDHSGMSLEQDHVQAWTGSMFCATDGQTRSVEHRGRVARAKHSRRNNSVMAEKLGRRTCGVARDEEKEPWWIDRGGDAAWECSRGGDNATYYRKTHGNAMWKELQQDEAQGRKKTVMVETFRQREVGGDYLAIVPCRRRRVDR